MITTLRTTLRRLACLARAAVGAGATLRAGEIAFTHPRRRRTSRQSVATKSSCAVLLGLVLATLVAACAGGSGSSGFDGEPSSEPEAIEAAAEGGTCVEFDAAIYCGSGAPFPFDGGATEGSVEIDEPLAPLDCTDVPGEDACVTSLDFTPEGFPAGTEFRAATAQTADGPWTLSNDMPPPSSGGAPDDRDVEVQVPSAGPGAPPAPLVVGVLVYLDAVPAELPLEAPLLRDFGADVVYVTHELAVAPVP